MPKTCISILITNIGPTRRTWTLGNKVNNSTDPNVGLYGGPVGCSRGALCSALWNAKLDKIT